MIFELPQSTNELIQAISIYSCIPIYFLGAIGALLNILVFLTSKIFREKPSISYLIILSLFDVGKLFIITFSLVLPWGYEIDSTNEIFLFCKMRLFIFNILSFGTMTCFCLAISDQYCTTSSSTFWQQFFRMKLTILFLIYTILSIPYLIYSNYIRSETKCRITNDKFHQYHIYSYFLLINILFPLLIIVFGLFAYSNANSLIHSKSSIFRYELDRQIIKMILVQIFIHLCTFLPYSIYNWHTLQLENQHYFSLKTIDNLTEHLSTISYASAFYVYICVSKYFRQQLKYAFYYKDFEGLQSTQIMIDDIAVRHRLSNDIE